MAKTIEKKDDPENKLRDKDEDDESSEEDVPLMPGFE
jgi:hypothetical protein